MTFGVGYLMLVLGLMMGLTKHPLGVGGSILFLYMFGSVLVAFSVSFVVGVFLFLTGVSGMMVAFLYVVALCPNPVFVSEGGGISYRQVWVSVLMVGFVCPLIVLFGSGSFDYGVEMGSVSELSQWLRDPSMCGGLAELMPMLGILLFLCMVSVVLLCGQQKQCLGGMSLSTTKRYYA
uniref:NADH deshydrogenase subunit 6 n=1 Tax=Macoma balthica TaxID=1903275 RepID=A0A0B4U457_MACBL|nr:NADH deshydrogenase subunit 6 [Macoma balthica]AJC10820.1 NADH deshydrogenase subunit 6 [Macoma balthica]AJC10833.1 NADH deshydrogenase subunit 6 [Macoma balthica]AJC10846.1 NADH deshydrogenase subunit 6 [Macoma balthica]